MALLYRLIADLITSFPSVHVTLTNVFDLTHCQTTHLVLGTINTPLSHRDRSYTLSVVLGCNPTVSSHQQTIQAQHVRFREVPPRNPRHHL